MQEFLMMGSQQHIGYEILFNIPLQYLFTSSKKTPSHVKIQMLYSEWAIMQN
jgi:hypothetical protein